MRIALLGKYPPIQGGTSRQTYLTAHSLAMRGHDVVVLTNAHEVEPSCRQMFIDDDEEHLERVYGAGSVRVFNTSRLGKNDYIPWAQPYASKLFGLGLKTLSAPSCDVIVGWYYEPYGLVASQLGQALRVPVVLRHAGSDIGRLANHPDLRAAYEWAMSVAYRILTTPNTSSLLLGLGAAEEQLHVTRGSRLPPYFSPRSPRLDLKRVAEVAQEWHRMMGMSDEATTVFRQGLDNINHLPDDLPTIGVYGKVGHSKGSYDLLDALESMLDAGVDFRFLSLAGGQTEVFENYLRQLAQRSSLLRRRTVVLPFLAPWRVPSFLRLCDLACFLERDFAIAFHSPKVATEILTCGVALVCSGEIADKQYYAASLVDGRNYYRVSDPKNSAELRAVLERGLMNPQERKDVAARGLTLARHLNENIAVLDGYADAIERV
jgi:glycosyltransferase involved in cell wall biosynthesis